MHETPVWACFPGSLRQSDVRSIVQLYSEILLEQCSGWNTVSRCELHALSLHPSFCFHSLMEKLTVSLFFRCCFYVVVEHRSLRRAQPSWQSEPELDMCLIKIKAPAASSLLTRFVPMKAAVEDINDQGGPPGSAAPCPQARPAAAPINSFLLKLFARQHKSILFCLRHGHQCEIHSVYLYIYILFFFVK